LVQGVVVNVDPGEDPEHLEATDEGPREHPQPQEMGGDTNSCTQPAGAGSGKTIIFKTKNKN
jgi:hypothetical protein